MRLLPKIILLFLVIVFNPLMLIAQDEAAPLIKKMQVATGNQKADLLNEISVVYRKTDRFKAMDYARQAYENSVENNYLPGKALAKKNEGICWFFVGNIDSAAICYNQALETFTKLADKKGMSACYNNLGLIKQETGKYDEALKFYQQSADMDHELGDEIGVALTLENMADIHIYRGEYKKALALTNRGLSVYMEQSYKPGILTSYINRGAENEYLLRFDESVRDYTEALRLARELNEKYYEIMVNSNLGVMYWHWKKPEIAMQYLTTALEMSDEADDAYNIDNTLKTMAEIYTSQKQYILANEIYQKILNRNVEIENKRQVAAILTAIGRNLLELNEIDKARGYLNKSLEITTGLKVPYELMENYRNLSYANAILHNFRAADSLQDLFAQTYTQIFNSDSIADSRKVKTPDEERNTDSVSDTARWVIAFLLLVLIIMMSVFAYRGNNKEVLK